MTIDPTRVLPHTPILHIGILLILLDAIILVHHLLIHHHLGIDNLLVITAESHLQVLLMDRLHKSQLIRLLHLLLPTLQRASSPHHLLLYPQKCQRRLLQLLLLSLQLSMQQLRNLAAALFPSHNHFLLQLQPAPSTRLQLHRIHIHLALHHIHPALSQDIIVHLITTIIMVHTIILIRQIILLHLYKRHLLNRGYPGLQSKTKSWRDTTPNKESCMMKRIRS